MHFLKSEAYSLSPDEYLQKFHTPHSVISNKGAADVDEKDKQILEEILEKSYDDDDKSGQQKEEVVKALDQIITKWLTQNSEKPLSKNYGLKIFGSYSLKANSYDGDIDTICIVPETFSREKHFFGILVSLLKSNTQITELFPIPDAYVPIIKFRFSGVQIDMLFCRFPGLPADQIDFLNGISTLLITDKQLKSLNGKKISKYKNFQIALKALKMWARNKGVYSQIYGYLGGAGFSIMLAKICQLFPNYSVLQLLDRFFFIYANWVWTIPILLEEMVFQEIEDEMTIYTPFEPFINSAHDVSRITSFITKKQFKSASREIQDINKGKKTWKDLFQPINFFQEYRYFIQLSVMGQNKEDFIPWKGNIESKMRRLIRYLENYNFHQQMEINPYPRNFQCKHPTYEFCCKYYMGLKISPTLQIDDYYELDFSSPIRDFLTLLEAYPSIEKTPKFINVGFRCVGQEDVDKDAIENLKMFK